MMALGAIQRVGVGCLLLVYLLVSVGCVLGGPAEPPKWARMGSTPEYPADRYLLGVGEADTQSVAERRAYAAVAKIFQARVQNQSQDQESYRLSETEDSNSHVRTLTVDSVTHVTTDKVLAHVHILDRWTNSDHSRSFVLAGIDRAKAEQALLERIADYDHDVKTIVEQAKQGFDQLDHVRNLQRALKILMLRETDNADLRVIRDSGTGVPAPYQIVALSNQLSQIFSRQFLLQVFVSGDQSEALRIAVVKGLTRHGFKVIGDDQPGILPDSAVSYTQEKPHVVIEGRSRLWDVELPDPLFHYVRWCGEFKILDAATNRIIGVASDSGREGHVTGEAARVRAAQTMQERLVAQVTALVSTNMVDDQPSHHGSLGTGCPE